MGSGIGMLGMNCRFLGLVKTGIGQLGDDSGIGV